MGNLSENYNEMILVKDKGCDIVKCRRRLGEIVNGKFILLVWIFIDLIILKNYWVIFSKREDVGGC